MLAYNLIISLSILTELPKFLYFVLLVFISKIDLQSFVWFNCNNYFGLTELDRCHSQSQ